MSQVTFQVSGVMCYMSGVRCQVSPFFLSGGASWSGICFQWGLPCLALVVSSPLCVGSGPNLVLPSQFIIGLMWSGRVGYVLLQYRSK